MTIVETPRAARIVTKPRPAVAASPTTTTTEPDHGAHRIRRLLHGISGPLVLGVLIVAAWWIAVEVTDTSIIVAPSPADVWHDFWSDPAIYLEAARSTLVTSMEALAIGVLAGTMLAISKWWSPLLAGVTELPTLFFRSLPFVALVPVASRVLGYGWRTTLLISIIIAFFPSFALVDSGLRHVPPGTDDLFSVLGARRTERLRRVALPAAMPQAATAIRLSATMCILGTMSSEYLTGSGGLGGLYAASRVAYIHPARSWTIATVTAVMSFIAFALASALERRAHRRYQSL